MATFQIHEDVGNLRNIQRHKAVQDVKPQSKAFVNKKYGLENRTTLQPVENGVRRETKRAKLTVKNKENVSPIKVQKEIKIEEHQDLEDVFEFTKDEQLVKKCDKGDFPRVLLYEVEYREDIWKYLLDMERKAQHPRPNYMLKQSDLSWNTRSILIDWLTSVGEEYNLNDQTLHLSVNYIDRFLSHISVVRNKFQLVGAAAMMLAAKVEEIYPPDAKEWSYLTGDTFTPRQVLKMEQLVLKVLRFRMQPPTAHTFIQQMCTQHNLDTKTMHLALYLSELVLLEGQHYLEHVPSKLAAASIALARHTLAKQDLWPTKLKEVSGYSLKQLSPVVQRQQKTFRDSPLKDQQAIQKKYKSEKYNRVALLKPRSLVLDDLEDEE